MLNTSRKQDLLIIVVGIPTSGKSTWAKEFVDDHLGAISISRDEVREAMYGKDYWKNQSERSMHRVGADEKKVTTIFDRTVDTYMELKTPYIILDNTHCKDSYISQAIQKAQKGGYQVCFKFFEIPMWKAHYRNIMRYLRTGKWIPWKVLTDMQKGYDKLNKDFYYERYMVIK